ncbi:MBL fold metallo-hydrolase [Lysobacter sp. S4-A87]|uniref:MBL fold metallo-hydrolase n=1 Tax=Lysobacter sp. S4-A87 TaxID=2925843 RepID=UPI001F5358F9|nr:MBL fold metallo-hydrolase [Lysobacter sp. S4-A87]UNK49871.1 MBL fold metallo-hydrolase [Lysobacter sp. S4-A87]
MPSIRSTRVVSLIAVAALAACTRQEPAPLTAEAATPAQGATTSTSTSASASDSAPGTPARVPYAEMPQLAPIGVRIDKHLDVPESARGPAIDPAKGYRLQDLGDGLYMVTDNAYQSMFLVYDKGVVVIDTPPTFSSHIPAAIAEVTKNPVTHVVYSHSHKDHIGGTRALGGKPVIIAQEETLRLLKRDNDPDRPLPTVTFKDAYTLEVGGKKLDLSYHGNGHEPGNIFISAPKQKVLMVVDVVFPGWMPWRRFAVAQDVFGSIAQVDKINSMEWDTLVGGHVARTGTHADVQQQAEFYKDLRDAAGKALSTTKPGEGVNPKDMDNPWAIFDDYIDRVVIQCVNSVTPKWQPRLAGYDVYIWDQCYAMEQALRID